ncbi:hypothetical protein [Caballeronia novacaledonica]|uniref:Uncharacterized protein n=1 Tax=Caballeronia novacaledonica TaxID=1544861 RepID=A0AA37IFQ1_9BURK|nr:hypothetical protein [Caballeronia novacaledonica]GJH28945.1 hypothetical protein CBA19CS42_30535 [Caballeronia novacaledonica]
MRTADVLHGRSLVSWSRAHEARAAWIGRFVRASAWVLASEVIDLARWNAAPFGERLAELTTAWSGRDDLQHEAPARCAPRLAASAAESRRARDELHAHLAHTAHSASAASSSPMTHETAVEADAERRTRSPVTDSPVARVRVDDPRGDSRRASLSRKLDALDSSLTRDQLMALAADAPHASPGRVRATPPHKGAARPGHERREARASNAPDRIRPDVTEALGARLAARVARAFARIEDMGRIGRDTPARSDLLLQAEWRDVLPDIEHGIVFESTEEQGPRLASAASPPSRGGSTAGCSGTLPDAVHSRISIAPRYADVTHAPARTAGLANGVAAPRRAPSGALVADAADGPEVRIAPFAGDLAPRPQTPAARREIDAVDFAEHLRRALIHDARRHGIEV